MVIMFKRANSVGCETDNSYRNKSPLTSASFRRERLETGQLEADFYKLFKSKQLSDLVIRCRKNGSLMEDNHRCADINGSGVKSCCCDFDVHKCVLAARSSVFAAMFRTTSTREAQQNIIHVPDIDACVMEALLEFIYAGTCRRDTLSALAADLLVAADKYDLVQLKEACSYELFIQLTPDNATSCLILADQHSATGLKANAKTFIIHHSIAVRDSENWQLLRTRPSLMWDVLNECLIEKSKLDSARLHEHARLRTQRNHYRHVAAVTNASHRLTAKSSTHPSSRPMPSSAPFKQSANTNGAVDGLARYEAGASLNQQPKTVDANSRKNSDARKLTMCRGSSHSISGPSSGSAHGGSIFLRPSAPFRLLKAALQQANNEFLNDDGFVVESGLSEENRARTRRESSGSSTSEEQDGVDEENDSRANEDDEIEEAKGAENEVEDDAEVVRALKPNDGQPLCDYEDLDQNL